MKVRTSNLKNPCVKGTLTHRFSKFGVRFCSPYSETAFLENKPYSGCGHPTQWWKPYGSSVVGWPHALALRRFRGRLYSRSFPGRQSAFENIDCSNFVFEFSCVILTRWACFPERPSQNSTWKFEHLIWKTHVSKALWHIGFPNSVFDFARLILRRRF